MMSVRKNIPVNSIQSRNNLSEKGKNFLDASIILQYQKKTIATVFIFEKQLSNSAVSNGLFNTNETYILLGPCWSLRSRVQKALETEAIQFEVFRIHFFQIELAQSPHFVQHKRANSRDLQDLKKQGITVNNLPALATSDPMCKYFDFQIGEVIKIYRYWTFPFFYFRVVK